MPYEFGSYGFHKSDIDVQVSKFIGLALAVPLLIVLSLHATIYHDIHLVFLWQYEKNLYWSPWYICLCIQSLFRTLYELETQKKYY